MNAQPSPIDIDSALVQLGEFSCYCLTIIGFIAVFRLVFLLAKCPGKNAANSGTEQISFSIV